MVSSGRMQAWRVALQKAILAGIHPESAGDASTALALMAEARESDTRTVRWLTAVLSPVFALAIFKFLSALPHETDPSRAAWLFTGSVILAGLWAVAILGTLVAWRRRPAALYLALGDIVGAAYLLG